MSLYHTIWIASLLCLAMGLLLGSFLSRRLSNQASAKRELEQALDNAENELVQYKQKVVDHFQQTVQLVDNMTASYQEVYNHLASGAKDLSDNGLLLSNENTQETHFPSITPLVIPISPDNSSLHSTDDAEQILDADDEMNEDEEDNEDGTIAITAPKDYAEQ